MNAQNSPDVAIIGAGIVGTSAAAFLAEHGASVLVAEGALVGAGASGRNSGAIQHPFDSALVPLYDRSLELYADLAETASGDPTTNGFLLPSEPTGLLLLGTAPDAIERIVRSITVQAPELSPVILVGSALQAAEPALAPGLAACRLSTGYPVPPAAATHAYAARARRAGATIRIGGRAELWVDHGRVRGIVMGGRRIAAGDVLVAAGPDSPRIVAGGNGWRPIVPVWGVNAEMVLPSPPRHVLEEAGVESVARTPIAVDRSRESRSGSLGSGSDSDVPSIFSLVTVREGSTLGSTFLPNQPDPARLAPELRRRGARFVPSLARVPIRSARACARPQSADGRPLLGAVPGIERLFIAAGHGPWGISLGPASAEVVVEMILGRRSSVAPETDVARFGVPPVPKGH